MAKAKKPLNFKSKEAYMRWLKAIHSIPSKKDPSKSVAEASPGHTPVKIRGKTHKVKHAKKK